MDAGWILIIALAFPVVLVAKVGSLFAIARWLLGKIPDEPDHSASVVYSKVEEDIQHGWPSETSVLRQRPQV